MTPWCTSQRASMAGTSASARSDRALSSTKLASASPNTRAARCAKSRRFNRTTCSRLRRASSASTSIASRPGSAAIWSSTRATWVELTSPADSATRAGLSAGAGLSPATTPPSSHDTL